MSRLTDAELEEYRDNVARLADRTLARCAMREEVRDVVREWLEMVCEDYDPLMVAEVLDGFVQDLRRPVPREEPPEQWLAEGSKP